MSRLSQLPSRRALFLATTSAVAFSSAYYLASSSLRTESPLSSVPVDKRRPGPLWTPPTRRQMMDHLRTSGIYVRRTSEGGPEPGPVPKPGSAAAAAGDEVDEDDVFDLLIVGGGATGVGTALDAASRGLKVACVERDDYSSGTSSKSTKLVHGGVRYLQAAIMKLDYGACLLLPCLRGVGVGCQVHG